jgi:broad specificity phosphatase PhoE
LRDLYLIRHGQAGLRSNYDVLSGVGAQQARHLGHYLRTLPIDRVLTGGLQRQQETARAAGFGEFEVDAGWSEFDLDAVYREVAPQLARRDGDFRREFESLQRDAADETHAVHRKWTRGDVQVVTAWIEGSIAVTETETFVAFRERVRAAFGRLAGGEGNVAVFTSATPIGLAVAQVTNSRGVLNAMRLAGALVNGSVTTLRATREPSLYSFNVATHLPAELHTHR